MLKTGADERMDNTAAETVPEGPAPPVELDSERRYCEQRAYAVQLLLLSPWPKVTVHAFDALG